MSDLRLYTFINFYLSSIQQGIQTQHVASELYNKYCFSTTVETGNRFDELETLRRWSMYHKTTITLNGGNNKSLGEIVRMVERLSLVYEDPKLPWATFHEDEQSLGGVLTSVGVVLPEEIYDAKSYSRKRSSMGLPSLQAKFGRDYLYEDFGGAWFYDQPDGTTLIHYQDSEVARFLSLMKTCDLAR